MNKILIYTAFWVLSPFILLSQSRHYVNPTATGTNTGTSWTDAFTNLHDALALALAGDEIWVAEGTYYTTSTNDRNAHFELGSGVRLYGSFAGTELTPEERIYEAHPTVLDGDIGVVGDSLDNTYNLLYLHNPDQNTVVDGLVFKNGQADKPGGSWGQLGASGAAMLIMAQNGVAFPQIRHCTFDKNYCKTDGGAVFVNGTGSNQIAPRFSFCTFTRNYAFLRGACYSQQGGYSNNPGKAFEHCYFTENFYKTSGLIDIECIADQDQFWVQSCLFENNKARANNGSTPRAIIFNFRKEGEFKYFIKIKNSKFDSNYILSSENYNILSTDPALPSYYNANLVMDSCYSKKSNGVIFWEYTGFSNIQNIYSDTIRNCVFDNNFSTNFQLPNSAQLVFDNVVFINPVDNSLNMVSIATQYHFNDVLILSRDSTVTLSFYSFGQPSNVEITNSTLKNVRLWINIGSSVNIKNTIWDMDNIFSVPNFKIANNPISLHHSLISIPQFNYTSTWTMSDNLWNTDPMFVAPDSFDLRLQPCSPAINRGNNAVVTTHTDLNGNPRIQGAAVDLGAYESAPLGLIAQPTVVPACVGGTNGSAAITPENACLPLQLQWAGPVTGSGANMTGLAPGNYTLTVTDGKNDTLLLSLEVPPSPAPAANIQTTPVMCGTAIAGSATPVVNGQFPPFQFNWSNGSTDSVAMALVSGAYALTITDARGCTGVGTAQVNRMGSLSVDIQTGEISCYNTADGQIEVQPANGLPPFEWTWATGESTGLLTGLGAGVYSGYLTDSLGCAISWNISFSAPDTLRANATVTSANGPTAPNGSITLTPTGGTGNITAQWSTGATTLNINGLVPGSYTVTLTDGNGCTRSETIVVDWTVNSTEPWAANVRVFPVPASEQLHWSGITAVRARLIAANGAVIREIRAANAIPVSDVPVGWYTLELTNADGVYRARVLVQR
jgi:predicted outer membrane repeat protein